MGSSLATHRNPSAARRSARGNTSLHVSPARAACLLGDTHHANELAAWTSARAGDSVVLDVLNSRAQLRHDESRARHPYELLVVAAEHLEPVIETLLGLSCGERPEVIAVGASSLDALRMRERGFALLLEVPGPWSLDAVGRAVEQVVHARLPLRALGRRLFGRLDLSDAVGLMRYAMLVEALERTGSKRAAARALGVTRPAIQQMAKSYSLFPGALGANCRVCGIGR